MHPKAEILRKDRPLTYRRLARCLSSTDPDVARYAARHLGENPRNFRSHRPRGWPAGRPRK